MKKKEKPTLGQSDQSSISRRQAIREMGYAAFATSTMFLLLNNPTKANSTSLPGGGGEADEGFGGFGGDKSGNETQQQSNDPWLRDDDPWR